ncbi:condensation domain-containing protein, partial [Streptomyces sp. NPDC058855]|uniref:condensation domain-containing protein n=1 Tax=Streptomyces sp. NPDC058855 TaxID=3346651 RepID=UPI00368358DF
MPTPENHAERRPLLAAQEGIWTGHQLDPDSPAYNTAEYVHIHGPVDPNVFDKALRHAVAEAEALNVRFVTDETGRPWQVSVPGIEWEPHIADEFLWYHRVHHIALDGFGLSLVARRVAEVYTALMEDAPLGESGFGTLESVRQEEAAYRASERFTKNRAYWTQRFADRPAVPSLTTEQALPARTFLRRVVDLDPAESQRLR